MKKTLFIEARTGGDFTMDAVWAGLIDKFGHENVIDLPATEKHREGIPQITGDIEKDYGAERRSLCYTKDHDKLVKYDKEQVNDLLKSGEIERIFLDERVECYNIYMHTIARSTDVPVVVVAGHDRFWNNPKMLYNYYGKNLEKVFADNWRHEYSELEKFLPMSYATNFDHLWEVSRRQEFLQEKIYDICFLGYNSHGARGAVVDYLLEKYGAEGNCLFVEKRPNTMESFIRKNEYFKKMAQSKICINLVGGAECGKALRFYEIPYVGSFMLSQRDSANQVYPFIENVHCKYFQSPEQLDHEIEWALNNELDREKIAKQGHTHAMTFHTARARVDYMYRWLHGQGRALLDIGREKEQA